MLNERGVSNLPRTFPDCQLVEHLRMAVRKHRIRVVKIHPNFSRIDISTDPGKRRVNSILRACEAVQLPVVFHGGSSPILGDIPASRFSIIENLAETDKKILVRGDGSKGIRLVNSKLNKENILYKDCQNKVMLLYGK